MRSGSSSLFNALTGSRGRGLSARLLEALDLSTKVEGLKAKLLALSLRGLLFFSGAALLAFLAPLLSASRAPADEF